MAKKTARKSVMNNNKTFVYLEQWNDTSKDYDRVVIRKRGMFVDNVNLRSLRKAPTI